MENRNGEWDNNLDCSLGELIFLIGNFFRRSSIYIKAYDNGEIDIELVIKSFNEAFTKIEINVRCLAPLEFVEFATTKPMDFGFFSIRKFSQAELYKLSQNEINEIFFLDSVWDIEALDNYWFIDVPNYELLTDDLLRSLFTILQTGNKRHRSDIVGPIKKAINNLILYNWNRNQDKIICQGFNVPFAIQIDEYSLAYPASPPDVTILQKEIEKKDAIFFSYEGAFDFESIKREKKEEFKANPINLFTLNNNETKVFIKHVNRINKIMNVEIYELWPFMKIAFDYLRKGLFSYDSSIEQYFFYVMVIEALLGEKKESLTALMANRLSKILGKDDKEIKQIKKLFYDRKGVYDIRSKLIHGEHCKKGDILNNLNSARELAQKVCIWFLIFLNNIFKKHKDDVKLIERTDLLAIIDFQSKKIRSINQLLKLTEKRFKEFPYISFR